ncbi:MAG TPA: sulfite exporter TauE/SafE family protein [Xanthobacteraceae bacterium]
MLGTALDFPTIAIVFVGALVAGFTTGLAGFGTGLVASGLWFHALPAAMVPPLVALASVIGQVASLVTVRREYDWSRALPYLVGGAIGVPLGVVALAQASPFALKASVGVILIAYTTYQFLVRRPHQVGTWGGRTLDGVVGVGGGFLGGFAGLSGPLPLIWLQLRGETADAQRATYQPFNLIVLALAAGGMVISGQITSRLMWIALMCLPATLVGAWAGARVYVGVSPQTFQRVVLVLLLLSGCLLIGQSLAS